LLAVRGKEPFAVASHLRKFAYIAEHSREYQGHGWGCAYRDTAGDWNIYKHINPIWEDDLSQFPPTTLLIAHARSAFKDRDIVIENNMPFFDGTYVYTFNGELRGVRIREKGRIGAEKLFNYIKRLDRGDTLAALEKAIRILEKRTRDMRAVNVVMAKGDTICLCSRFTRDSDYFTMHYREGTELVICSDPYPSEEGWKTITNGTVRAW
jgi:glutamine amidotransferase